MFDLQLTNTTTYCESYQKNPLLWKILYREGDTFTDQTGWFKCKDFFNDVVEWLEAERDVTIYRFNNRIKRNEEGVYVLLQHVAKGLSPNLKVINKQLKQDLGCSLTTEKIGKCVLLLIPNECWKTTYRISLLSACIRVCNYGTLFKEWKDLWEDFSPGRHDGALDREALNWVRKWGFKVPPKYDKYRFYAGPLVNSENMNDHYFDAVIHDNGVCAWVRHMEV